jgi:ubiquinone/menaquinone biosynthesis C-methylase UbiE
LVRHWLALMSADREVERLATVYGEYRQDRGFQAKWDSANPGNRAIARKRQHLLTSLLEAHGFFPLAGRRILDVGCGNGTVLASFKDLGASAENLYGVDLLPEEVAMAREAFPDTHFQVGNAENLVFQSNYFDLVLLYTVFSSFLDTRMALNVSREVSRVLKPGGAIVWYDFIYNNPRNPHVRGMKRANIAELFPEFQIGLYKITLFPPLARRLGPLTAILYPALAAIPCLRTHYLGLLLKPMG